MSPVRKGESLSRYPPVPLPGKHLWQSSTLPTFPPLVYKLLLCISTSLRFPQPLGSPPAHTVLTFTVQKPPPELFRQLLSHYEPPSPSQIEFGNWLLLFKRFFFPCSWSKPPSRRNLSLFKGFLLTWVFRLWWICFASCLLLEYRLPWSFLNIPGPLWIFSLVRPPRVLFSS